MFSRHVPFACAAKRVWRWEPVWPIWRTLTRARSNQSLNWSRRVFQAYFNDIFYACFLTLFCMVANYARRAFYSKVPAQWRRRPGGQRMTWDRCVRADSDEEARVYLRLHGLPWEETIMSLAQDRESWRQFVARCGKRRGAAQVQASGRRAYWWWWNLRCTKR